jgi:hypothetical protein
MDLCCGIAIALGVSEAAGDFVDDGREGLGIVEAHDAALDGDGVGGEGKDIDGLAYMGDGRACMGDGVEFDVLLERLGRGLATGTGISGFGGAVLACLPPLPCI